MISKEELIETLKTAWSKGEKPRAPYGADLRGADLGGADLRGADLRGADLGGADLGGAYLRGAYLGGADLRGADLRGADLGGAYLRGADLGGAYLRGAYLRGADLGGAYLRGAYLGGAYLGGLLHIVGLHPYEATFVPTADGWNLQIGCWSGTTTQLRDLITQDHDWPEATGEQITQRRPLLAALADMCDVHAEAHKDDLALVIEKWGTKATETTEAADTDQEAGDQ